MILHAVYLSLMITAIYVLFQEGMLLGWFRIIMANIFDRCFSMQWSTYLQKPLWGCLTCMASVWTILLTWKFDIAWILQTWKFDLKMILLVCGMNAIIDKFLSD